jgi:hypothetical protein
MKIERNASMRESLNPEKVAYWYLRLNGFLQIENFVVHPSTRGGQRTDADLLGVRFPYRAERLLDNPDDVMIDDVQLLSLSTVATDVVIAEVKTNDACTLNGPWTEPDRQNVNRVLAAIGCLPRNEIGPAAACLYATGLYQRDAALRIRLVALGRERNDDLTRRYAGVSQVTWPDVLSFIWDRFHTYRRQKSQVDQWDAEGRRLKQLADESNDSAHFASDALSRMGVRSLG